MGIEWEEPMQQEGAVVNFVKNNRYGFLLCTDGWWDWITEPEMEECLKKSNTAKEWMDSMLEIVLKNGTGNGMDNYSAITVIVKPSKRKTAAASSSSASSSKGKKSGNLVPILIGIICALVLLAGVLIFLLHQAKKKSV